MKRILCTAIMTCATLAHADEASTLSKALDSPDTLKAMLADPVSVGPILFADAKCIAQFGSPGKVAGADRDALAACLRDLGLLASYDTSPQQWQGSNGAVVTFTLRNRKIIAIGPAALDPKGSDAKLPTAYMPFDTSDFAPSPAVRATIDRTAQQFAESTFKLCTDTAGAFASRRLVRASGVKGFDKEATAYVAARKLPGFQANAKPVAFCTIVRVRFPEEEFAGGVEGGVVGGVAGGDPYGAPPPPPPPPPPAPPQNVPPTLLESLRVAGEKNITPDDPTKREIARAGKDKIIGSFKLCLDVRGTVTNVSMLKSTGFEAYDTKLKTGMRGWRYRPYTVNGTAVPVCTAITFIYKQLPPDPPPPKP